MNINRFLLDIDKIIPEADVVIVGNKTDRSDRAISTEVRPIREHMTYCSTHLLMVENHSGYSFRLAARVLLYAPSHRQDTTHTTAFVTPVVELWLEREIAQWVGIAQRIYIQYTI